ncbi:Hypothetical predicted protein [Cloeon dipterum]|uniref:Uncharacterized protein n=1 Tax=Cloeon dipterum TaxID=197152 RepID=A0A8S1E4E8_9INSE|nr:Hypothetical predicted protein [Cloeon dipterum]
MFGAKIRNWVETHFVRHRKKRSKEAKGKAAANKSSPSTDPGPSTEAGPSSSSVHSALSGGGGGGTTQPTKRVTLVSPTLSCKFSYAAATDDTSCESPKRPTLHAAINNNNKLGARYSSYLSSPESAYSTGYSTDATSPYEPSIDATLSPEYYINIRTGTRYFQSVDVDLRRRNETLKTFGSGQIGQRVDPNSKREDCKRGSGVRSVGATPPQPPPRKSSIPESIFAQTERASPIKQVGVQQQQQQQFCNSPRQRCRIRTNPWLSSSAVSVAPVQEQQPVVPLTPLNEDVSTAATVGSWHVADSTTTCDEESCDDDVFSKEKPVRRRTVAAGKKKKRRGSFSSDSTLLSTPSISRCSSAEEEDATLNELGRFDESYTYDKETDILSDSDATDCEVDTSRTLNTEQESTTSNTICDTELDFIDVGDQCFDPVAAQGPPAQGHCTYHLSCDQAEFRHLSNSAASSKMKRASQKRRVVAAERPQSPSVPRPRAVESPSLRARNSPCLRNKRVESRESLRGRAVDSPTLRIRMMAEKRLESGNSTPVAKRRSTSGSNSSTPQAVRHVPFARCESGGSTPVRRAPADLPLKQQQKVLAAEYSESERKLIEADKEADRKYRQLIKEAESLLVHMRNSTVHQEVELETPTVEAKPFPQQQHSRPDPGRLSIKIQKGAAPAYPSVTVTTPSGGPPRALVTFRSVDLNSPVASEAPYCPQSEPVKRKVYTSAALQRLQDHFKLTEMDESSDSSPPEQDDSQDASKKDESVSEYGSQEERRKRRQEARNQYKLAVARRNNVLSILEELKLDLQVQSARLHDTYRSTNDLRSPCVADVTPSPNKATGGALNIFSPIRRAAKNCH